MLSELVKGQVQSANRSMLLCNQNAWMVRFPEDALSISKATVASFSCIYTYAQKFLSFTLCKPTQNFFTS